MFVGCLCLLLFAAFVVDVLFRFDFWFLFLIGLIVLFLKFSLYCLLIIVG